MKYFKNNFTNNFRVNFHQDPVNKKISEAFAKVTTWLSGVGLKGISSYHENRDQVSSPEYPFRLNFVPNPELSSIFKDEFTEDYKDIIVKNLPSGTLLYEVFAVDEPLCEGVKIGELVSNSEFTTSTFGDKNLFFRHALLDEDDFDKPKRMEARDFFTPELGQVDGTEPRFAPTKKCPFGY